MINLLPAAVQQDYRYARRNSWLMHVVVMFGIGLIGIVAISAAGVWYLHQAAASYTAQATITQKALDTQRQTATEAKVQEMSNSLKLAVQVLSKEVLFSKLLQQLGASTPSNATLSNLSISGLQGGVDITANAANYSAATQLQVNLADPNNKIFDKADIVSITCAAPVSGAKYPCTVVIRALFAKNNPYLFINNTKASS
jgi:hypothetical protein